MNFKQQEMMAEIENERDISRNWATPMTESLKTTERSKKLNNIKDLQQLIDELNFLAGMSRPDTAFALNKGAFMTHRSNLEVYGETKRMLACLFSTQSLSFCYRTITNRRLTLWIDSSYMNIRKGKSRST